MIYVVLRDGGHGEGEPGKETPYIKSLGRRIQEEEFNEPVSNLFGEEIKRHGVIVHDISAGIHNVPLKTRTDEANRLLYHYINKYGAGNVRVVLVSFHFNAYDGTFDGPNPSGISVHIQPGSNYARKLAESVGKYLRQGTKQVWRGIVEQNLHITREFKGVGILTENGFMDHPEEAALMLNKDFQREVAVETAQGVLEHFGLKYKPEPKIELQSKEEEDMLEKAIVINAFPDFPFAEVLAMRLKAPIYVRSALPKGKLAKKLYVVGGTKDGLEADNITLLSGHDRFDVARAVENFLSN